MTTSTSIVGLARQSWGEVPCDVTQDAVGERRSVVVRSFRTMDGQTDWRGVTLVRVRMRVILPNGARR